MYVSAARSAIDRNEVLTETFSELGRLFNELFKLVWAVKVVGEVTPHVKAMIVSFGEKLSAALAVAVLRDRGLAAKWLSDGEAGPVAVKLPNGSAKVDYVASEKRVRERLLPLIERGVVPVVMGFTTESPSGRIVLLGRGGSDYTATLLARFLRADEVRVHTDVEGMMSADPRRIRARNASLG